MLTPTEYRNSRGRKCKNLPDIPCNRVSGNVSNILDKQEYCDDTINFLTCRKSFKVKKKLDNPKDKWKVFPNIHPAIMAESPLHWHRNCERIDTGQTKGSIIHEPSPEEMEEHFQAH